MARQGAQVLLIAVALLVLPTTAAAAASGRPISIAVSMPKSVLAGTKLHVTGRVQGARRGAQVILETRGKGRWQKLDRLKLRRGTFSAIVPIPIRLGGQRRQFRAVVLEGGHRLKVSSTHVVTILSPAGAKRSPLPTNTKPTAPGPPVSTPQPPAIEVTADQVILPPGSQAAVTGLGSIEHVTSIGPPEPTPYQVSATTDGTTLSVATTQLAPPGEQLFTAKGDGCTPAGCGQPIIIHIKILVRSLSAPAGTLDGFTSPSPDRIAAGTPTGSGGVELADELNITLGTPDEAGTRAAAEAVAAAVEGVVSGGLEDLGVYEIRWPTPQNLDTRTSQLSALPGVTAVAPATPGLTTTDALPPGDWNGAGPQVTWPFTQVHAQQAWDTSTGSNVKVGIVDGGLVYKKHEDLNVVQSIGGGDAQPHATHVAGLACAEGNGIGLVGMAWGCPIVSAGIGDMSPMAVLEAAKKVAQSGVGVVNMSLGYQNGYFCHTASEQADLSKRAEKDKSAFRQLFQGPLGRNIIWTVSAGNNCAEGVPSPWGLNADLPNVISVAATNDDGSLASFSDFGPGVKIAAPGGVSAGDVGLWSTWVEKCGLFNLFTCGAYHTDSGTSMSSPVVAGIAALVREAHPEYGAAEAAACLDQTAGNGTGWAETQSAHPTNRQPIVPYSSAQDRVPIVNAEAAVACTTFNSEAAESYVGSWSGNGWILDISQESEGVLRGVNQATTYFVNGCTAEPGLTVMTNMTSSGSGQWNGYVVSTDASCISYSYYSPMALRAVRTVEGQIALVLAWPQSVSGTRPMIDAEGSVVSSTPYYSIWLTRPGAQALKSLHVVRKVTAPANGSNNSVISPVSPSSRIGAVPTGPQSQPR
jgi:subtilisin family serine protease